MSGTVYYITETETACRIFRDGSLGPLWRQDNIEVERSPLGDAHPAESEDVMSVEKAVERIRESGVIGAIRARSSLDLMPTVDALQLGGLTCIEVTLNTPGALDSLRAISRKYPHLLIGAGTVIDIEGVVQAVAAGARFVVTPVMSSEIIQAALDQECAIICGAMTPTEAYGAWKAGANLVKIFPADLLGPAFFRAMQGPLPQIPLVSTGGVTAETTEEFVRAGAAAVCAGSWLISEQDIREGDYAAVTARARSLCAAVTTARGAASAQ